MCENIPSEESVVLPAVAKVTLGRRNTSSKLEIKTTIKINTTTEINVDASEESRVGDTSKTGNSRSVRGETHGVGRKGL